MHELEFAWFPESISDYWKRKMSSSSNESFPIDMQGWVNTLKSNLIRHYGISTKTQIPREYTAMHVYPDKESIACLWILMDPIDEEFVDLSCLRKLIDLLFDIHELNVPRSEAHSDRLRSLLTIMGGGKETGSVSKENFQSRFPVWFSSWSWWSFGQLSIYEETLAAWNHVDISDCGVLSRSSLNGTLLPYVFRLWYPLGHEDTQLQDTWIVSMMSFLDGSKTQWMAHWAKFQGIQDGLNFVKPAAQSLAELTDSALSFLDIHQDKEYLLSECKDFVSKSTTTNPKFKSRAFSLWIFSIDHNREPPALPESLIPIRARIDSQMDMKEICQLVWGHYYSTTSKKFDWWFAKTCPPKFPIMRSHFIAKLLTEEETNQIWESVADTETQLVLVKELRKILTGIQRIEGGWIVKQWLFDILNLCPSQPVIDEPSFKAAFPVWFATLGNVNTPPNEDLRLAAVWPPELDRKVVYSKQVLTQLLTAAWNKYAPQQIPCQSWWLDRCTERLEAKGPVTRKDFCALFPTIKEINIILFTCKNFGSTTIADLLFHTASPSKDTKLLPNNFVEEFFLIANLKPINSEHPIDIPRDIFTYAFPLWCAAHYVD